MDKEFAKKWVAALRSGEFTQCTGVLHGENGYCCLGVACVVAGLKEYEGAFQGAKIVAPIALQVIAGIDEAGRTSIVDIENSPDYLPLWKMNDQIRLTFDQIADVIAYEAGI